MTAVVVGSLCGIGIARLLFTNVLVLQGVPWFLPWDSIAVAAAGAIVLGAASSIIPFRRISRQTVVEAIRTVD